MPDIVHGLGQGIVTLLLQIVGLAVAIVLVSRLLRRERFSGSALGGATALVVGIVTVALIADDLSGSATALSSARRASVGTRQGINHCFSETGGAELVPFINWLRYRMPSHAVYTVSGNGEADLWCITLALLPRLPATGTERAQWFIGLRVIPASVQARLTRHDPSVVLYAPGLALEHLRP